MKPSAGQAYNQQHTHHCVAQQLDGTKTCFIAPFSEVPETASAHSCSKEPLGKNCSSAPQRVPLVTGRAVCNKKRKRVPIALPKMECLQLPSNRHRLTAIGYSPTAVGYLPNGAPFIIPVAERKTKIWTLTDGPGHRSSIPPPPPPKPATIK